MYSERFSGFVRSGSLPISCYSLSCMSIACVLCTLNDISWYCVLHVFEYFLTYIVSKFQFTSELCLTSQSYSKNMSVLFMFITTTSIFYLCLLISISSDTNHLTFPFLVLFILKTSNIISAGFILIFLLLTSCLLIPICVHLESTSACNYSFFLFCVLTFVCTFSSLSLLSIRYIGPLYCAYSGPSPKSFCLSFSSLSNLSCIL